MLTLLLVKFLPARAARFVRDVAEAFEEAHALRQEMHRKFRLGFDS